MTQYKKLTHSQLEQYLSKAAGILKGAEGKIREELMKQDLLEAVIGLGPNIF